MPDQGPLLELLKSELTFLEQNGTGSAPAEAASILRESTCLRFKGKQDCVKCPLIDFVPVILRDQREPCQHIPLNARGETLHTLRRQYCEADVSLAIRQWLSVMIQSLSQQGR